VHPKQHMLDNECSQDFKDAIKKNNMTYQLATVHDHRRNNAEKAIQTFKNHFIAILCGTDETSPMHLWCRLLEQAEHTLNMLRPSRITPKVSAYAHLHGTHDYNSNPFAPMGCKVEMYEMPTVRETWATHTVSGFYIGNSWEHYRNHKVWVKKTKNVRAGETVFFNHKYLTQPTITTSDALLKAADDLSQAVKGVIPQTGATMEALEKLVDIFKQQAKEKEDSATRQRVRKERALTQRVRTETRQATKEMLPTYTPQEPQGISKSIPKISQNEKCVEKEVDGPATRTRARTATRYTQDVLLHIANAGREAKVTAKSAASKKYPIQFLCDYAGAVLDGETGELLEYRHLITRPKYKQAWGTSFGNEIGRLAQGMPGRVKGTDTMFFYREKQGSPRQMERHDIRQDCL